MADRKDRSHAHQPGEAPLQVDRQGQPGAGRCCASDTRAMGVADIVGLTLAVNLGGSGAGHAARQLENFMSQNRRELGKILSRRFNLQEGWYLNDRHPHR